MKFKTETAEIFVPDGQSPGEALARTTHLAVGAHQDDLEIMAIHGILQCFQRDDKWFTGVVMTNGSGSPRDGLYGSYTDDAMRAVRAREQKKAAIVGEYAAQIMLDYPSSVIKDSSNDDPVEDLRQILMAAKPKVVYAHNPADKHATHVATTLRVIKAIRSLEKQARPQHLYGCEVWRDLGWMLDEDKVVFDVSAQENLQMALLGIYDSQVSGGKRYDLATMGHRRANATYFATHDTDVSTGLVYGMDLTPLIDDPDLDVEAYVQAFINRFAQDVTNILNSVA